MFKNWNKYPWRLCWDVTEAKLAFKSELGRIIATEPQAIEVTAPLATTRDEVESAPLKVVALPLAPNEDRNSIDFWVHMAAHDVDDDIENEQKEEIYSIEEWDAGFGSPDL